MSYHTRLTKLEEFLRDRPANCKCQYVEIVEGVALTDDQKQILEENKRCYERNHNQLSHVGFKVVLIAKQREGDNNSALTT